MLSDEGPVPHLASDAYVPNRALARLHRSLCGSALPWSHAVKSGNPVAHPQSIDR